MKIGSNLLEAFETNEDIFFPTWRQDMKSGRIFVIQKRRLCPHYALTPLPQDEIQDTAITESHTHSFEMTSF